MSSPCLFGILTILCPLPDLLWVIILFPAPRAALLATGLLLIGFGGVWALHSGGAWSSVAAQFALDLQVTTAAHRFSEATLLGLVALWGGLAVTLLSTCRTTALTTLSVGGLGAVVAYGTSEALKALIEATRPCQNSAVEVATCPGIGSMAYPSNHTVIAAALASALVLTGPRLAWIAVILAAATGAGRVLAGHHYPHDVIAGAGLGVTVTWAVVLLLTRCWMRRHDGAGSASRRRCRNGLPDAAA